MKASLVASSTLTLTLLGGFVAAVLGAALYTTHLLSAPLLLVLTVGFNLVWWLVSPAVMDWSLRLAYRYEDLQLRDLAAQHPEVAEFVRQVAAKHRIRVPRLGLIHDQTPTAFTYGSTAQNARLVVSTGLFHYLDTEEATAVYAHELGHIVHRDFIVMSLGATLVQLLYQIYVVFTRSKSGGDRKGSLAHIGLAAYVFYWIGTYLLLFLSRTREYMADQFAAEHTRNPNALAMALTKIAFGILQAEQEGTSKRLLESTRALGIFDPKSARCVGLATEQALDLSKVGRVFLFDLFNPWAALSEFQSTHPLTGKRIRALANVARTFGQTPPFDFAKISAASKKLDMGRMRQQFVREVGLYFAPWIGALVGLAIALPLHHYFVALAVGGLGLGILLKGYYSFSSTARAMPREFLDLMTDPYASPMKGKPVRLKGVLIGKATAGSKFSEDFMLQDNTGVVYVNYESPFGPIGNLFFGARKGNDLIGQEVEAVGWFRRGMMPQFDLLELTTSSGERIKSWTFLWALLPGLIALAAMAFLAARGL
ncbi:MAG TPA: M48 family metalloprotease [Stenomitos sp.]